MKQKIIVSISAPSPDLNNGMIDSKKYELDELQLAYNKRSWLYSKIVAPIEFKNHLLALAKAKIKQDEKILEVAVGAGKSFLEIMKRVGKSVTVYGVDISPNMLNITEKLVRKNGYLNFELKQANSRTLPFEYSTFDVLYNAYMLDLIPLQDMPSVLQEFKRVLKPGGRLVLLNMSKPNAHKTLREYFYQLMPAKLVLYLAGGCRPVLMEKMVTDAGFKNVKRTFLPGRNASEIITAEKPDLTS